jgi:hypothetical protein
VRLVDALACCEIVRFEEGILSHGGNESQKVEGCKQIRNLRICCGRYFGA